MSNRLKKRSLPSSAILGWRQERLAELGDLSVPRRASSVAPLLEPGNRKTGTSGRLYRSMLVWNLPAAATCPGASPWCLRYCYNADPRKDVFPLDRWLENWAWVQRDPVSVEETIVQQIASSPGPVGVRVHSSGDFFSSSYIELWRRIARRSQEAQFWAYTRSWADLSLADRLERLRLLPNFELFASWDQGMGAPPAGWRLSVVVDGRAELTGPLSSQPMLRCPEENDGGPSCADCGYCLSNLPGGVIFAAH